MLHELTLQQVRISLRVRVLQLLGLLGANGGLLTLSLLKEQDCLLERRTAQWVHLLAQIPVLGSTTHVEKCGEKRFFVVIRVCV
jgi:hypothetical protein